MSTTRPPNIVFVLTDDQGYGDLGCHGNPILQTPHIDRLHHEGVRFTDFHVGPTCAPTRSGLFTGHYANSTGVWHTVGGRSLLRKDEVTLADALREHGYRTGLFGKWHLGDNYPYRPQDRGFETVVSHGGGGISQVPDHWGNDYFDDTYSVNGEPKAFEGYCTDVFFREASGFIREHRKKEPFFCCITTNAPHSPYNVPEKYRALYTEAVPHDGKEDDRARFYGMITNIDENVGALLALLEEEELLEETIVMFMTDNGTSCGGPGYHTCGLKGTKNSEYDGGHRVPFFLRFPEAVGSSRDIDTLTAHIDFMPTLLELCGIEPSEYSHCNFHGKSLVPLLQADASNWPERTLVTDSQRQVNPVKWRKSAVMTDRWRLINGRELYDIREDRGQENDIHRHHPMVVAELREAYENWWNLVSTKFEEEIPISIGAKAGERICLTGHDWRHPENPWEPDPFAQENNAHLVYMQGHIRQGQQGLGYHEIKVEQEGTYRFELRRWPEEENRAIRDGIPVSDADFNSRDIQDKNHIHYKGGEALPFTRACLEIHSSTGRCGPKDSLKGNTICTEREEIQEDANGSAFTVRLPRGFYHLRSWFEGAEVTSCGAYYVYVSRKMH